MDTAQFCDISQFQPVNIDWAAYNAWSASGDGVARVAMRASYGVGYTDQHFQAYRANALNAGIDSILYYHYAYPQFNAAPDEANWMHQVVGAIRSSDVIVLDFEENTPHATAQWALEWLAQQERNYGGKLPMIYASSAYIQQRLQDGKLAKYPLWLANWTFSPDARPACPSPWSSYAYLQYTDKASGVPGIPGIVDANISLIHTPLPTTKSGEEMLNITDPFAAAYFTDKGGGRWHCAKTQVDIIGGILAYYRAIGGAVRLPMTGEMYTIPDVAWQVFEAGILVYDPKKKLDNPTGSGPCYLAKLDSPLAKSILATSTLDIVAITSHVQALLTLLGGGKA